MGVSITAYSNMILLPEDGLTYDDHSERGDEQAFVIGGFEQSADGLVLGRWYAPSDSTEHHEILTMSYTGYNRWRELLCSAALGKTPEQVWNAAERHRDAPFYELINFADNEGTIGPLAAGRLLADFIEHHDTIRAHQPEHARFGASGWIELIDSWITGLRLANTAGLISFC